MHDRPDKQRAEDLERMAADAEDATYGETDARRARVPGWLSGDVGPKGKVSAQLREGSRTERATYGEVPRGSVAPGGARLLLIPLIVIALALLAVVALLGWLLS